MAKRRRTGYAIAHAYGWDAGTRSARGGRWSRADYNRAVRAFNRAHPKRRKRTKSNPHRYRHNPKGGGMGIGMIALLGVGAFFLMRSGALGSLGTMFGGQPAVPGYTAIGGNAYRNNATGQVAYRQPTGQMTTQATGGTIVPSGGSAWTAPLVQAGVASIPLFGAGLASMIKGFFTGPSTGSVTDTGTTSPTPAGTTGVVSDTGATSTTSPDILAIPEPGGPIAPAPGSVYDWFGGTQVGAQPAPTDIFASEVVPQTSLDVSLAPDTSTWFAPVDTTVPDVAPMDITAF
jgi:hypothetical protein